LFVAIACLSNLPFEKEVATQETKIAMACD